MIAMRQLSNVIVNLSSPVVFYVTDSAGPLPSAYVWTVSQYENWSQLTEQ